MMNAMGLGTLLRLLIAKLDGDVQSLYDDMELAFRPRFFPIVQQLLEAGPTPVSSLARATGVSQPAATQTIGEMSRLGLVETSAGADARERLICLTSDGIMLAERLKPVWEAVAEAARELDRELPQPLFDTLTASLRALDRNPFKERIRRKIHDA